MSEPTYKICFDVTNCLKITHPMISTQNMTENGSSFFVALYSRYNEITYPPAIDKIDIAVNTGDIPSRKIDIKPMIHR